MRPAMRRTMRDPRRSGWEGGGVRVVVGAVLTDGDGRILAARRDRPPGWELPGGKVEPGESEPAALARELQEELGVAVEVGTRVGPDVPIGSDLLLRAWTAVLTDGEPAALEHAELRWLAPHELDSVPWLPADRPIVAALTSQSTTTRDA
jgi:8-oxo-dGTP diphosphatase